MLSHTESSAPIHKPTDSSETPSSSPSSGRSQTGSSRPSGAMKKDQVVKIKEGLYPGLWAVVRKVHRDKVEILVPGFALPAGYSGPFQVLDLTSVEAVPGEQTKADAIRYNRKNCDMRGSYEFR